MSNFKKVVVGGTFDKFHKGHKKIIEMALKIGDHILIGLTTDNMIKSSFKQHPVSSFKVRKRELVKFIKNKNITKKTEILPLNDPYGLAYTDKDVTDIVVSKETTKHALEINKLRRKRGLKTLNIIVIDLVLAEDLIPISTTRIRRKEIDREGKLL